MRKKTKKKEKVVAKAKQLPKPTKEGVKKQGKRVGNAVVDNLTPDNMVEVIDEGVLKGLGNIATDVFMGKKVIPESPKMETVHRMLKKNYELIQEQLEQVEEYVNRCCSEKNGSPLILQKNNYDKMFELEQESVKKERREKYVNIAKATARQTRRTVHRVDKDLKEGLLQISPVSNIIKRLVNPEDNIKIYEIFKSIMLHLKSGRDLSELSPEQDMVINDLKELIEYSNKHKGIDKDKNPPGIRIFDIIRLLFGFYIYNLSTGEINAHLSQDLVFDYSFGIGRYEQMKNNEFKKDFIDMFNLLFGIKKGEMRSMLTKVITKEITSDSSIIQRLYDRGGKKKKKTFKKKKKHKKK